MASVVVSAADVARMRRTAFAGAAVLELKSADEEAEGARRAARRAASEARTARFPNTLAALRKRKLAAREERLAAEEAERVVLDGEEAALRTAERVKVLEAAARAVVDNTDKMKLVRSQVLASYVADTRERQIALAAARRAAGAAGAARGWPSSAMRAARARVAPSRPGICRSLAHGTSSSARP